MTREEFEQQYASRSDTTVGQLHDFGLYAVPCNCGEATCQGWQVRTLKYLLVPSDMSREVEHIPDDWNWADLERDLIAEGETGLLQKLRAVMEQEAHHANLH